jgi:hypothetical protein
MVNTIVQFIPLEEEIVNKTELSKKADTSEDAEGDTDTDGDDETSEFLTSFVALHWSNFEIKQHLYSYYAHKQRCALVNIITPPPEV